MFRRAFATLVVLFALIGATSVSAAPQPSTITTSISLNQAAPTFGASVTFTEVYPKVYGGRQPQYPNQPDTQLDCYQAGIRIWTANAWTTNKVNLGQGWSQSVAGPFALSGVGNGYSWTSGGATCYGTMFYFDGSNVLHFLAQTQFEVLP